MKDVYLPTQFLTLQTYIKPKYEIKLIRTLLFKIVQKIKTESKYITSNTKRYATRDII